MTKTEVKVKDFITMEEKAIITNYLVDSYFVEDEDGVIQYVPYMFDSALITVFFLYCVDGIEFEEKENIYMTVHSDNELMDLYTSTLSVKIDDNEHPNIGMVRMLHAIVNDVADMVDFKKQQIVHDNSIINAKLLEILDMQKQIDELRLDIAKNENKVLQQQAKQNEYAEKIMSHMTPEETATLNKKLLSEDMDYTKLAELITQKYLESDIHKANIVDLKKTKTKSKSSTKHKAATITSNVKSNN